MKTPELILMTVAGLVALFIIIRLIAPGLLALPYSAMLSLFVRKKHYVDPMEYFPESAELRQNWRIIKAELEELMRERERVPTLEDIDKFQNLLAKRDGISWRVFLFKAMGNWVEGNCWRAPHTAALLRSMPKVTTAMFSIMEGGKHIPSHFGFFGGIFRYHLALIVPKDAPSYLIVKGKKHYWKEGQDVMFDDTCRHEARNESAAPRAILLIDVLRERDLPAFLRPINRAMFAFLSSIKRVKKASQNAELRQANPDFAGEVKALSLSENES